MEINTISQLSPLIVLVIGCYYRHLWDKGLRAIFCLYFIAGLFEITSELIGGMPIVYHLWTPIEVGFLLYIYSQWSDLNYKAIFISYLVIWVMLRAVGLESLHRASMDTLSLVFAGVIFIFIPMYVFGELKSYQKIFMLTMAIYYGGCFAFILTINGFENKVLAWEIHSLFNIIAAIGSAGSFIIRNDAIVFSTRHSSGDSTSFIRDGYR